jgi:hypothetical protein
MIDRDTPEENKKIKNMKIAGGSSLNAISFRPSKVLIGALMSYSLALQVIQTAKSGCFFLILN